MKKRNLAKRFGAVLLALAMSAGLSALAAEPFSDVSESDYYYPAVQWGTESGITNGVGGGRFDPQGQVTRAQVVTFLWRMAGTPAPAAGETFSDVEAGGWYETAVQWAVENKITNGTGNGQFSPDLTCDRAMCLTLLYRMMGSPLDEIAAAPPVEPTENITLEELGVYMVQQLIEMFRDPSLFPDVVQDAYYELAVVWGGMNGILTDDNTGTMKEGVLFRPADPCVRGEMISFLYQTKLMQDKANEPDLYEYGSFSITFPQAYSDLLYRSVYAIPDDEEGMLLVVSELASRQAAEAMGEDPDETGAGELFGIGRVSEAEARKIAEEDIGFGEVFAKDENGMYYVFYHPTDVRYVRETNEQMAADQDQWIALNEWARRDVKNDILQHSEGLTPVDLSATGQPGAGDRV